VRTALDVHRELLARDVPHEVVRVRRRLATADDLPAALGLDAGCVAVRLYRVTRRPSRAPRPGWAAVLVPAGAVPDPAALLDALDAESVRPATGAETNSTTGYPAGLVSPVGLPADVEVLADIIDLDGHGREPQPAGPARSSGYPAAAAGRPAPPGTGASGTPRSASPQPS
jgi:prolyl-tRNA editing enzyme YbaK/EbsC (Cys-tRNA(Pro) deacylase)